MAQDMTLALLQSLSRELAVLSDQVENLGEALGAASICDDGLDAAVVIKLQAVDPIVQTLTALSVLSAEAASGRCVQSAVAAIPLSQVQNRMRAALRGEPETSSPDPSAEAGDLLLFE